MQFGFGYEYSTSRRPPSVGAWLHGWSCDDLFSSLSSRTHTWTACDSFALLIMADETLFDDLLAGLDELFS